MKKQMTKKEYIENLREEFFNDCEDCDSLGCLVHSCNKNYLDYISCINSKLYDKLYEQYKQILGKNVSRETKKTLTNQNK